MEIRKQEEKGNMEKNMKKESKSMTLWSNKYKRAACGMMGLSLVLQNLAFAAGDAFSQLKDISSGGGDTQTILPAPDPMDTQLRLSIRNSVPQRIQSQAAALCLLAREVIARPQETGARFSADPKAYLAGMGIKDTVLDLNSREVKIVLALGDPEMRDAAMKGDTRRYLRLLEDKGLLGYNATGASGLLDKNANRSQAKCVTPVVAIAELAVGFLVVVEAATAVHYVTYFWTEGATAEKNLLDGIEGKVTSLFWGPRAAQEMMSQYISEKSEEWASAIEELPSVKAKNLSHADIKKLLEVHMAEELGR